MTFLALVVALILVHYWDSSQQFQRDEWFYSLLNRFAGWSFPPVLELLLVIMLPAAAIWLLLELFGGWLFGLVGMGLTVCLLLYSFGRGDYEAAVTRYRSQCGGGDLQSALLSAEELFAADPADFDETGPEGLHRWMKKRFVYMAFERWFAVIFYFVLFGPVGAVAYRLLQIYAESSRARPAAGLAPSVLHYIDWVPSRLMLTAFALTGDYVGSRALLSDAWQDLRNGNAQVLSDCAHAALGLKSTVYNDSGDQATFAQVSEWEVDQLHGLISRSAIAWLLFVSLLTIFL
ncbi:regulatory signaling modulator protein AmpE [Candidatus Litorirhabdus singularis]|uniref:regulatory signaling modulator protein AmpE n=1 Tax=Candidatus Litorirhabdus singularis TaxID=2518993 RepID=UPI00242C0491|nr:regulatory signaling modulator protein AmpE [Candidatus Litorirhabdus singularis]